ncbi:hypothetical protein QWA68_015028 [Fusarium oxysporum]|nr:hypothetical protein QWA68_015028 [Fusarium oxysporum]
MTPYYKSFLKIKRNGITKQIVIDEVMQQQNPPRRMYRDALLIKGSSAYPERDEEDETLHEVSWKDFTYMDADVWDNFQQGTGITRSTNNRRNGQYRGTISHLRHCRRM